MAFRGSLLSTMLLLAAACAGRWMWTPLQASADEPKAKAENTISLQLGEPVVAQKLSPAPPLWISEVTDRTGNPQPMLVLKERGGVFLDKQPTATLQEALEQSLRTAKLLARDRESADLTLRIYLFHFGLAAG